MLFKNYPNICNAYWEDDVKAVRPQWVIFTIGVPQFEISALICVWQSVYIRVPFFFLRMTSRLVRSQL